MIILSVEGNIGAGKSSILRRTEPHLPPGVKILMEPVGSFQNYKDMNPLKLFYEDPTKYAFFAQNHIIEAHYKHFLEQLQMQQSVSILVTERTLYSSVVFTNALFKMGWLNEMEKEKLLEYSQKMIANVSPDTPMGAHYVFYLNEYPHVCMKRILERGRQGEKSISCTYLSQLEAEYHDYCEKFMKKHGSFSLRMAPATIPREEKEHDLLKFIDKIIREQQQQKWLQN